jgi:hypothetical protein
MFKHRISPPIWVIMLQAAETAENEAVSTWGNAYR